MLGLGVLAWSGEQNLGSKAWTSIASSSDGGRLVAGVTGGTTGNLWISDNSGATWAEVTPQQGITFNWAAVTSSAGGANLAAVTNPGRIWTSSDYGVSWASPPSVPSAPWAAIAGSSDGTKLVAAVTGGNIWTSADSGQTCKHIAT